MSRLTGVEQSAHTPGPWVARKMGFLKSGFWIRKASDTIGLGNVAVVPRSTIKPFAANAHLIAAAPDLLAACKEVLAKVDLCDCGETDCATTRLRKAIAKAEGRS
jgi:hypothetical protein